MARELFDTIKLTQKQRNRLYTTFDDMDEDGSGLVRMAKLFSFLDIEGNEFSREIFQLFDSDGNGELTFLEFVCVVSSLRLSISAFRNING